MSSVESPFPSTEASPVELMIAGVTEPVIFRYFETLNGGDFEATSALFAVDGAMQPPFEAKIVGPEAIATYLKAEAREITLKPREGEVTPSEDGTTEVQVRGRVRTTLFEVNVAWSFILSPQREILFAKIKLLASPKELLGMRKQEQ